MGDDPVSPYLLRPLRSLDEVLGRARPWVRSPGAAAGPEAELRSARSEAGERRRAPAPFRPRVVWVNDRLGARRR